MDNAAIYRCNRCGETRQYGNAQPERGYDPLIPCDCCQSLQRHRFVRCRPLTSTEKELRRVMPEPEDEIAEGAAAGGLQ